MATLCVQRMITLVDDRSVQYLYINGQRAGVLASGVNTYFEIKTGEHLVQVQSKGGYLYSNKLSIDATNATIYLQSRINPKVLLLIIGIFLCAIVTTVNPVQHWFFGGLAVVLTLWLFIFHREIYELRELATTQWNEGHLSKQAV